MTFIWDETKSRSNVKKHGVSFVEAESVFLDEAARLIADPDHSQHEERFILLGMSSRLNVLVVVHAYKEGDELIRIISARRANRIEQNKYKR